MESAEQQEVRAVVRSIVEDFSHDWYVKRARAGLKVTELWEAIGESGFVGVNLPEEYGGGGMGIQELSVVAEELAAAGSPLLMLIVSPAICGTVIARFGTDEQKDRWLPGLATGRTRMAFAITEPDAGSNSHNIATTARRDGDDWILTGTKYYCSGADEADAMLVVARTGVDEKNGRASLSLFIVETPDANLQMTVIPVEVTAPEKQFTLFFDNVRVPAEGLLGNVDDGLRQIFFGLNPERIMSAATSNGIGRYALDRGARYARERQVWGAPIATHQGLAHPLAEAYVHVELARLMTSKAAWMYDSELDAGEASNMAKFAAADASVEALERAIQIHGGNGMSTEYGLADAWGFARVLKIAPVSREMVLNYISQHSLGLPRSY
ncbi:acyl-CoA/acyl-ACP dehydrogenase [Microbacterium aerolatum]|uniref:acyl-CoA dehydrogenase family protein n=1 Tax=Microbacterium aerolatum TaxID=153731 RepID=UPI002001D8F1|nr:acyl-CoA dehydrogenase family protein [Microbacterium aerolatum]MCK3771118.1 acyl-CoA/acyl-ACP dehydrogenase [Microbacterium aerolatum]